MGSEMCIRDSTTTSLGCWIRREIQTGEYVHGKEKLFCRQRISLIQLDRRNPIVRLDAPPHPLSLHV